ncbi:hypothetical protein M0208_14545 [Sphingomonas sp. SUN019]|uniref:hypothetical protein n=1 Tax=Sphingomonas sp. SUN019 TaxID=2937788 RepID=UPI0021646F81|nr:hypothetical protein [Sphingomonas sp. SUN019]UVO51664.1 hypothetical protein M0208_14545 [Sphingomonas sp. SUN019]
MTDVRRDSAPSGLGPLRLVPRSRLGIGVTGHRLDRLGVENGAVAGLAIGAILGLVEQAAGPLDRDALRLVTCLADGADSIAADVAADRGWTVDVVLPFFREDYAQDFAVGAARDHYLSQVARCAAVMELPGDRASPDGAGVAYERAGRIVLAQSDVLIAVWDGGPARGRGGAPQIVAEAVLEGIPVIHIDPAARHDPVLLWDGLEERDLGQQTIDTVARGDLSAVAGLVRAVLDPPADREGRAALARFERPLPRRRTVAFAYPLLLAIMGVRRLRLADVGGRIDPARPAGEIRGICTSDASFAAAVRDRLAPRFAHADSLATRAAQLFRSVYVTNFAFAALAVVLSLLGLALPSGLKPVLITLELLTIGTILIQTRAGMRGAWHRAWLDNRALAERIRCLAVSSQLGELELRAGEDPAGWVGWYARATAREVGLPSVRVDPAYLASVRDDLTTLIDGQIAYLNADAHRMHRLEHRLHLLGTILFGLTAFACVGLLAFKAAATMVQQLHPLAQPLTITATILSAALPAIGAAIYGIRMQGDFAGIAERSHTLGEQLQTLRAVIDEDATTFDTLSRRARRVTGLLTADLASWLQTYRARPLALPG